MKSITKREARIWARYKRNHSTILRNWLMEHYLPFVQRCAERLRSRLPSSIQVEDLANAGTFGLAAAIEAFDPRREIKFSTFGARRVTGAMLDELRANDHVPRAVRTKQKKIAAAAQELEALNGRRPMDDEIAERLKMSAEQYAEIGIQARAAALRSLDLTSDPDAPGTGERCQIHDPRSADPAGEAQRQSLKQFITRGLSRAERLIIMLHYVEALTFKEIGVALDLSESRISQMHSAIIIRLKACMSEVAVREAIAI